MSNGNDQQNFPPQPENPPEGPKSGSAAEESAPEESPANDNSNAENASATANGDSEPQLASPRSDSVSDQETLAMDVGGDRPEPAGSGDSTPSAPSFGSPSPQGSSPVPESPAAQDPQPPRPDVAFQPPMNQNQRPQFGENGQQGPGAPPSGPNYQVSNQQASNQPGPYGPGPNQPGPNQPGPNYGPGATPSYSPPPNNNAPGQGYPGQPGPGPSGPYAPGQNPTAPTGSGPQVGSQPIPQPAPAPGFDPSSASATRADVRQRPKKSKTPLFIALGSVVLVLVLLAVGLIVIRTVNSNNYGPDRVAADYVAALSKGDFAAAEKIAPSPRPEGTNVDLLAKTFTDSSSAKIENAKVVSADVKGDQGTVIVSYDLGGNTYQVTLPAKKDGKQDVFFDKWALTGPALHVISLDLPAVDGLTVNGAEYKAKAGTTSFAVFPGNYEFKVPASKWVNDASDTAEVNFPQAFAPGSQPSGDQVAPLNLNLSLSATPEFQKEVQKQVEADLKKCFDNKDIKPKCKAIKFDPSQIPVTGESKKLSDLAKKNTAKWDIKKMPQVTADFSLGDPSTGAFSTTSDKQGKFDFSVQGTKAGSSYFSNGNPLSVSGSVKIEGDKLSIAFF